jgi:tRNA modification GTPase
VCVCENLLLHWLLSAPHSFTGEDCAEFHVHGGPSVVLALLTALGRIPNCSHAQAGDFTKRAFFNGKLELTEVEGLADLIHAETEAQRKQALRQMEGDLGTLYSNWTQQLKKVVAHVEAVIDFGEDENIEDTVMDKVKSGAREIQEEIEVHLSDGRRGERLRSGVHVAILGAPNAGKSSLLNKLCQRPAAIVSPHAGTTRDVVESALDIAGYPVILSDTAGLRLAHDPVEQEGVRRALNRVESADLCVLIGDLSVVGGQLLEENVSPPFTLPQLARHLLRSYSDHHSRSTEASSEGVGTSEWLERAVANLPSQSTLVVMNKTDLLGEEQRCLLERRLSSETDERLELCWLSCRTGDGVDQFMESFTSHLERLCGNPMAGNPSITQARHRQHLTQCALLLHNFIDWIESGDEMMLDKSAEELRTAIREIGRITGRIGVEDILDVVFSDFCIGK